MAGEFINLKVKKVAIHKIFKREDKKVLIPPVYNDQCSGLDSEAKRALETRITKAFGNDSHSLKMKIENVSEESVYKNITDFWQTDQEDAAFLQLSKQLTFLLAKAQNSRIYPDAIVVIVKGTTKAYSNDFIAIIKAEIQDGFNIVESNGEQLLGYVNNLLLTRQQKLHKIGIFINNQVKGRKIELKDVDAFLFDSNNGETFSDSKAEYFYKSFLGLTFREDADVITNQFYITTKKFINECIENAAERIRLQTALRDYLYVNKKMYINPAQFANEYLGSAETKDSYLKIMEEAGVPSMDIRKDVTMIKNGKTRNMSFDNSINLTVPIEEFDDTITIEENENGDTIIKIKGKYVNEK